MVDREKIKNYIEQAKSIFEEYKLDNYDGIESASSPTVILIAKWLMDKEVEV